MKRSALRRSEHSASGYPDRRSTRLSSWEGRRSPAGCNPAPEILPGALHFAAV